MFSITSTNSDRALVFSNRNGDYFRAALEGISVTASIDVYAYTDANGLNKFFQALACCDKPWGDARKWQSLEGEFSITAHCDALGHVVFTITLRMQPGHTEEANVSAGLSTDFGQLATIAENAREFFGAK